MLEHSKFYGKNLLGGKRTVVTGAGSGIGRQIAYTLAEQGAQVVILDYIKDLARNTAKLINTECKENRAFSVVGDVSDQLQLRKSLEYYFYKKRVFLTWTSGF